MWDIFLYHKRCKRVHWWFPYDAGLSLHAWILSQCNVFLSISNTTHMCKMDHLNQNAVVVLAKSTETLCYSWTTDSLQCIITHQLACKQIRVLVFDVLYELWCVSVHQNLPCCHFVVPFCDVNRIHLSHTCYIAELLVSLLPNYPARDSDRPSFIPSCPETQWEV